MDPPMPKRAPKAKPFDPVERPKKPKPQYDEQHRQLRKQLLALYPICQVCNNAWAEQAHHRQYPATCIAHYQALCIPCHNRISRGDTN